MLTGYVKKGQLLFIASFLLLIAAGSALLMLPWWVPAKNYDWSSALFTATSAVCVTGLTVNELREFGWPAQLLIYLLVQVGGVGIMTLSASILLALGRGLSFSNSLLISGVNDTFSLRGTEGLTRTVIRYSVVCEGIGCVLIYIGLMLGDSAGNFTFANFGVLKSYAVNLWNALFITASSFCSAGFSPFPDSLQHTNCIVKLSSAALTISGGIGVYVIYDLAERFQGRRNTLRLHSKVVLFTTAVLLAGGTVLLMLLNPGKNIGILDAFFLSSSSRTCGFTTFNIGELSPASGVLLIVLMLIGGGPGSTAGGMKVTTLAVVFSAVRNTIIGNREILLFNRNVGMENVMRAFTIMVVFLSLFCVGGALLHSLVPGEPLLGTMFEAASALSTTGLSMGFSSHLTTPGAKVAVCIMMFIGRMGPFMLLLFLLGREKSHLLTHPHERIIIG